MPRWPSTPLLSSVYSLLLPDCAYDVCQNSPGCIGVDSDPNDANVSEDCLKLAVFAPSNATASAKLPVFFQIQGGGFSGSSSPRDGTTLVKDSNFGLIVVSFAYRVGPYGFLGGVPNGSSPSAPEFSVNNGLKDQRKALEWTRAHIAAFGGDPEHIVIAGESAGGGSGVIHLANPANKGKFVGAALESAAWPPLRTPEEAQFGYDNVLSLTGCAGVDDTLACLRSQDTKTFQTATRSKIVTLPGGDATAPPVYQYSPLLDHDVVHEYTYDAFRSGDVNRVPLIIGDTQNEGNIFTPASAGASLDAADQFATNQFPQLKRALDLSALHADPHYAPLVAARDWRGFASLLYADMRYNCPNLFLAWALPTHAADRDVWTYRWDVGSADHTAESGSVWGGPGSNATLVPVQAAIHSYWISFIKHLDPNAEVPSGTPRWEPTADRAGAWSADRLLFSDKISNPASVTLEKVDDVQWNLCRKLQDAGVQLTQ